MTTERVLWHDGYHDPVKDLFTAEQWPDYIDALIDTASSKGFDTVGITLMLDGSTTLPADALTYLQEFVIKAESSGLSVGLQFGPYYNNNLENIATIISQLNNSKPLLLGVDAEDPPNIKAANAMEFVNNFKAALDGKNVDYSRISIWNAFGIKNNWEAPLLNVYEYYSQPDQRTNNIFNSNVDNPKAAFKEFYDAILGPVPYLNSPDKFGYPELGAPAFAISRDDSFCLGGSLDPSKANPCGGKEIFGHWSWDNFDNFLDRYTKTFPDTEYLFVYQGDQLPCDWLVQKDPNSSDLICNGNSRSHASI